MNDEKTQNAKRFLLGNKAIARAALEAGIHFASGYPGTPSSEIIRTIVPYAQKSNVHVEWSVNEKVACEGSAAAAFAGLRSLAAMKNAGLSVALDFLTHLSMTGLGANNVPWLWWSVMIQTVIPAAMRPIHAGWPDLVMRPCLNRAASRKPSN